MQYQNVYVSVCRNGKKLAHMKPPRLLRSQISLGEIEHGQKVGSKIMLQILMMNFMII